MASPCLITGATGFLGSHLAEACVARGIPVRTIARPGSDTAFLEQLGIEIRRGDLTDGEVVRAAADGVDLVFNCAAKVGDTGPVEEYRKVNVEPLRALLEAVKGRPLRRFVHLSSLGVYAARHHHGTDETEPLPDNHMDGYTQTKVESDRLALAYHGEHGVPVVVLRPGFIYGPRDRTVMPRLIRRLSAGKVHYLGAGERALNTIYVGNLVDAIFLAVEKAQAVGQAYNLTDGERVTKQRFFEAVADGLGLPRPHHRLPGFLAALMVMVLKWQARRAARMAKKPWVSQAQLKFLLLNLDFSIEKAKRELSYSPRFTFDQGMKETITWYRQQSPQPA